MSVGMTIDISIIICSRNRCEHLRSTLDSLEQQLLPSGRSAEVLVIDSGSTDDTWKMLATRTSRLGALRPIHEPIPGLSQARNRALKEARGEVLVWTDDDLRFRPDWLRNIATPLLEGRADATKGKVLLPPDRVEFIRGTPLETRTSWVAVDAGMSREEPGLLVGANMAFHRRVLEKVPAFDTEVGPGPHSRGFGDDTLFSLRLREMGFTTMAVFEAEVEHHFELSRLDMPQILSVARRMGRSRAYIDVVLGRPVPARPRLKLARVRLTHVARMMLTTALGRDRRTRDEIRVKHESARGYLSELVRLRDSSRD